MFLFLAFRHAYHSTSTPPVFPPKNTSDLKPHKGTVPLQSSDAVIIHPGAMLSMLDLLVSVESTTQPEVRTPSTFSPGTVGLNFSGGGEMQGIIF